MKINTIETSRLFLRGFEKEDARFAISIWNDPEMGEYLADEAMETVDAEYLKEIEALGDEEVCCYLISELQETGERIGTCSFMPSQDGEIYDIAYCVHKKYWRKGFATEMIQGMIDYAKIQGAKKITVCVDKENVASNAVVRKFGFTVAEESAYKKRGTDKMCADYKYELDL